MTLHSLCMSLCWDGIVELFHICAPLATKFQPGFLALNLLARAVWLLHVAQCEGVCSLKDQYFFSLEFEPGCFAFLFIVLVLKPSLPQFYHHVPADGIP